MDSLHGGLSGVRAVLNADVAELENSWTSLRASELQSSGRREGKWRRQGEERRQR